jgi:hypothetical protein
MYACQEKYGYRYENSSLKLKPILGPVNVDIRNQIYLLLAFECLLKVQVYSETVKGITEISYILLCLNYWSVGTIYLEELLLIFW